MDKYAGARALIAVFVVLGWIAIGLGALMIALSFPRAGLLAGLALAAPVALGGLILLGVAQLIAAQLDTAENTTAMVGLLEAISKGGLGKEAGSPTQERPQPAAPSVPAPEPERDPYDYDPGRAVAVYWGRTIMRQPNGFRVDEQDFDTVEDAKNWIRGMSMQDNARL